MMSTAEIELLMTGPEMISDAEHALRNFKKGSKLRDHYIKLVMMNNIFRAFVVAYELPPEYKVAQEGLLQALKDVEARKNRAVFLGDQQKLDKAFELYRNLVESSEPHELIDMVEFVDHQRDEGRWIVSERKTFQKIRKRT